MRPLRISGILLLLAIAGVLAYSYAPARASVFVAIGRNSGCPLSNAMDSENEERRQISIKDRILHASKLVRADGQGFELWDTPKGPFWIPRGNRFVLPFNLAEMERKIYGSGEHFIHPGDIVLDCGASDGDFSREALKAGAKLVIAIEVAPKNIECLRRNLSREIAAGTAIVYPKGVWDKEDTLPLSESDDNFAADTVVLHPKGSQTTVNVPLTTIDHLVADLKLDRIDFVKMDIEGAEPNALEGGRQSIGKYHPRMALAVYHKPDHWQVIPSIVKSVWSGYATQVGPCEEEKENHRIHPEIMYFY